MPAITVDDTLVLPRAPRPDPTTSRARPVAKVVQAHAGTEGAGVPIRRAFPGQLAMSEADPFLLLDHAGPTMNGPGETKGASVASPPRLRDRDLHARRRDQPSRHDRRRRGHRRRRDAVDDRRRRHPARRAPHRAPLQDGWPLPRRAAVGQPAALTEDDHAPLPVHRPRFVAAPHFARRRRADPAHRRRRRRLRRPRRNAHPDHLRARDPGSGRPARSCRGAPSSAPSSTSSPAAAASAPKTGRCRMASSPCSAPVITSS